MGVIEKLISLVFGGGRNAVKETAEVFRENAEAGAQRAMDVQVAAMKGFSAEFRQAGRGRFDRFMDGMNRLPRPAMALGCLGLFVSAMANPVWFAERMAGIALVPEPLWWLLGVVVSFYFGARHQAKGQEFQRAIATSIASVPQVVENIQDVRALKSEEGNAETANPADALHDNPALRDWQRARAG
ncbi:holin family protein [Shimia abyssi]|uniref:Holin (3TMs family) n=1 Tax=Shimia abyssi TaxID=1662395 RepID=A0A2P8FG11_9RHOB|nr:holin family protein [Shimia abyssi]PSL20652.1 holin (3TMs family) [Shimia abyssi]